MMPTDPIEARLASALRQPMTASQAAQLDELVAAAHDGRRQAPRARLRVSRKAVFVLAVLIVVPLGAAASGMLGGGTESPRGLVDAAARRAEIEAARAIVPIPPGSAWPPITVAAHLYSRDGGRSETEYVAFCLWSDAWLEAHREGDGSGERRALERMQAYQAWKRSDDLADESFLESIDAVVGAATLSQPGPVSHYSALNCVDS